MAEPAALALELAHENITVVGCTFTGNTAGRGAAVYVYGGSVTFSESTFEDGVADEYAGGMTVYLANVAGDHLTFTNNAAALTGGQLYVYGSTFDCDHCDVDGGSATDAGGAFFYDSVVSLVTTSFTGNTATDVGGGFLLQGDTVADSTTTRRRKRA